MDNVIRETIDLDRGKRVRVVGVIGGSSLNVDVYDANGDVVFTEPTAEHARALRDLLDRFLGASL